jgi:serine/threonine-protein kinase RsbW
MKGKTMEVHLPSELGWERAALDFTARVARRMGFPDDRVNDLTSALAEAIVNAIEHGNAFAADKRVRIIVNPASDRLNVTVRDHSLRPFPSNVATWPKPDVDEVLAGRAPPRGWGIFLMRALVDAVEFRSTARGNGVGLTMFLHPPGESRPGAAEQPSGAR